MSIYNLYAHVPRDRMALPPCDDAHHLVDDLRGWITNPSFPCVGAKAALSKDQLSAVVLSDIRTNAGDMRLLTALFAFVSRARRTPTLFQSFAAIFEATGDLCETSFEACLWRRVQAISDLDRVVGHDWDNRVSADPANPRFSLSIAGEAFFVVGLHPRASRPARRFGAPALIFNMHAQFEKLRARGRYESLRQTILERDEKLAGSINPMLKRHGEASEARQYSGRAVSDEWRCPFSRCNR